MSLNLHPFYFNPLLPAPQRLSPLICQDAFTLTIFKTKCPKTRFRMRKFCIFRKFSIPNQNKLTLETG